MVQVLQNRVLKLNRNYMPLEIVTARDAFDLLYREIAEVITIEDGSYASYTFSSWAEVSEYKKMLDEIDEHDEFVHTPNLVIQVPRIIRVLTFDKVPVYNIKLNRKNIYTRDNNKCQYCGKKFDTSELNIDHVIPKAQGGLNDWDNLVCSCIKCNQRKRDRTPKQANMSLIRKPFKPNYSPSIKVHIGHKKYKDWSHFVSDAYWNVSLQD